MSLKQLTAAVEQLTHDVEAATPEALEPLTTRCRDLQTAALWEHDAPGKVPRLLNFAGNCLEFAVDPEEACKYLRLAVGALQERAKRVPVRPPLPAA